jgi:hypothetical protein
LSAYPDTEGEEDVGNKKRLRLCSGIAADGKTERNGE